LEGLSEFREGFNTPTPPPLCTPLAMGKKQGHTCGKESSNLPQGHISYTEENAQYGEILTFSK